LVIWLETDLTSCAGGRHNMPRPRQVVTNRHPFRKYGSF